MSSTPYNGPERRNSRWDIKKILGTCAIALTLVISILALRASGNVQTILNRRSNNDRNFALSQAQQLCFARLQGEFDSAIGDAALSTPESPERQRATVRLQNVNRRLSQIEEICYGEAPDPNPMTPEMEPPPTTQPPKEDQ